MYSKVLKRYFYLGFRHQTHTVSYYRNLNTKLNDRLVGFYKNAPNKAFLWFNWFLKYKYLNTNIITFIWARKHIKLSLNCLYPTETVYLPLTMGKNIQPRVHFHPILTQNESFTIQPFKYQHVFRSFTPL